MSAEVAANEGQDPARLLAGQWHPTKNGELRFGELSRGSGRKVWWLGPCGHEWESEYRSRTTKGSGCPVCSGHLIASGINDLATISPEIASEWHPTKNGEIRPDYCASTTNRMAWWLGSCGHEWKSTISSRTYMGSGCPYCSSRKLLPGFNDLKARFPEVAAEWHPSKNGDINPDSMSPGSTKSFWWLCRNGHVWKARAVAVPMEPTDVRFVQVKEFFWVLTISKQPTRTRHHGGTQPGTLRSRLTTSQPEPARSTGGRVPAATIGRQAPTRSPPAGDVPCAVG